MAKLNRFCGLGLAVFPVISVFISPISAASFGHLAGLVQNESGQPLANVLVTVLQQSSREALPILARTNQAGHVFLRGIETGRYEVRVKSAEYRVRESRFVEIVPEQIALVKLVLLQLLDPEPASDSVNLSVKTILRTPTDRRLIFRDLPGPVETVELGRKNGHFFENAVFQVYTNAGLGTDYLIFPSDSASGTTTNFALVDSLGLNQKYVVAGQLNSGEDSLWRLKNLVKYQVTDNHAVQFYLGYGRMSFQQPSLSLLGNPIAVGTDVEYTRATGTTNLLSAGFEDSWRFGDALSLVWGLELSQVRNLRRYSFMSPSVSLDYSPRAGTSLRLLLASKRSTQGNSVYLPDGELVNLADSVHYARVGDQFSLGTARHYVASLEQRIGPSNRVEFATFTNRRFGGTVPFLAVLKSRHDVDVVQLDDEEADTRGYRLTFRRAFGKNVKAEVSYVKGEAVGMPSRAMSVVLFDDATARSLIRRQDYHSVCTQIEALIPQSQTNLTALVKLVTQGSPITSLDPYSDVYDTANQGMNLFVRQIIPVPVGVFSFLGLDFLAAYRIEALLDVRNLLDDDLGVMHTTLGDVVLVRTPRSVRGGIALKF